MKISKLLVSIISVSLGAISIANAEDASIPKEYRGTWVTQGQSCKDENALIISDSDYGSKAQEAESYTQPIPHVVKISKKGNGLVVKSKLCEDGNCFEFTKTWELDAKGNLVITSNPSTGKNSTSQLTSCAK